MTKAVVETEKEAAPEVMTLKNFRANNTDIENFYRFVHENGLRREAGMMLEYAIDRLRKTRKNKRAAKNLP